MNRIYNSTPYPREIRIVQSLEGAIKSIREFSIKPDSFLAFRGHADINWDVALAYSGKSQTSSPTKR